MRLSNIIKELCKKDKEQFLRKQTKKKQVISLEKKVKLIKLKKAKTINKKLKEKTSDLYSKKLSSAYKHEFQYKSKLDYDKLFSYIGSGKDAYSEHISNLQNPENTESTTDILSQEKVDNIMRRKMISDMLGGMPDYIDYEDDRRYRLWKTFNKSMWWWKIKHVNNTFGHKDMDRVDDSFYCT